MARGLVDEVSGGTDKTVKLRVAGYLHTLDPKIPPRTSTAECGWCFAGNECAYASTTTASAGSGTTTITCADTTNLVALRHVQIAEKTTNPLFTNAAVQILTIIDGTHFTISSPVTFVGTVLIRYADCLHTFADCSVRQNTHRYGGFRGVAGILSQGDHATLSSYITRLRQRDAHGHSLDAPGVPATVYTITHHPWSTMSPAEDVGPIPLVYGRRTIRAIPVERSIAIADPTGSAGDRDYVVGVYALCEGEIDLVRYLRTEDGFVTHQGAATGAGQWWYWRPGAVALDAYTTPADWIADKATQQLSQNRDFRSATGTAYSQTAYVLLQIQSAQASAASDPPDMDVLPSLFADIRGRKVQRFNADGSLNGSKVWSQNPAWCLADLLMDTRIGPGFHAEMFDWTSWKATADLCDVQIFSKEGVTTATVAGVAAKEIPVLSVAGFAPEMAILLGGSAQTVDLVDPVEQRIYLKANATWSIGAAVQATPPAYSLNIVFDETTKLADAVQAILAVFRGQVYLEGSKLGLFILTSVASIANSSAQNYGSAAGSAGSFIVDSFKRDGKLGWVTAPNVIEVEYSRGSSFFNEPGVHRITDHANGGANSPRPVKVEMKGCSSADIANVNSFGFKTGLIGLLERIGDRVQVSRNIDGAGLLISSARLVGKDINEDLSVTMKLAGERTSMAFDSFRAAVDLWTGHHLRIAESGEPHAPSTLTIALQRQAGRSVTLSIARAGFNYTPVVGAGNRGRFARNYGGTFELHASTTAGFTPAIGNRSAGSTFVGAFRERSRVITWDVPDAMVEVQIYLKLVWLGIRAAVVVSNELSTLVYRMDRDEMDPTQPQGSNPENMVYEGDFVHENGSTDNGFGWAVNPPGTLGALNAPNAHTTPVGGWGSQAFANPTQAYDGVNGVYAACTMTAGQSGSILFSWAAGTKTGVARIVARLGVGAVALRFDWYYSLNAGTTWYRLNPIVDTPGWTTFLTPLLENIAMANFKILAACTAATVGGAGDAQIDDISFRDVASATPWVGIAGNLGTVRGNGTNSGQLYRRFPGRNPVDYGLYFRTGSLVTVRLNARRCVPGQAATDDVQIRLTDVDGTDDTLIGTITAADIGDNWTAFAMQFQPAADIGGTLRIFVQTKSTIAIHVDKLSVTRGDSTLAWNPSAEEQVAGYYGDLQYGDAISFERGSWTSVSGKRKSVLT
jgi:hypothetical protein